MELRRDFTDFLAGKYAIPFGNRSQYHSIMIHLSELNIKWFGGEELHEFYPEYSSGIVVFGRGVGREGLQCDSYNFGFTEKNLYDIPTLRKYEFML